MKTRPRTLKHMRGAAAVEFAIVLIPLLTLVTGVAEFGHAIAQYEALTKATRDAARYLSTHTPGENAYPLAQAQCLATYGNTACTGSTLVTGLTTSMVVICDSAHTTNCTDSTDPTSFSNVSTYDTNNAASGGTPAGSIGLVEVKIKGFPYSPIEPFINLPAITFDNIFTVMRQAS